MQIDAAEMDKKLRETELQEHGFVKSMESLVATLNQALNDVIQPFIIYR